MTSDDPAAAVGSAWRVPMRARDVEEEHRASTPLELLFDLTFVVAVSAAAARLARDVSADRVGAGLLGYLTVFFAIWWAWMNFTWFASAYDTDDVLYRLLTLLQMAGVLVLAAGIPAAAAGQDFGIVTLGYVIMRVAMVVQWSRAAAGDLDGRGTARTYVIGTIFVQLGWVLRLLLPAGLALTAFFVLVAAEVAVPLLAERGRGLTWHPDHIAERYGLFTIIVLGECVLATSRALEPAVAGGWDVDLLVLGAGGLVMLFGAWWMYFLKPAAAGLAQHRNLAFWWGYGHYGIFASLAALGAGLQVAAEDLTHTIVAPDSVAAGAVAVPLVVFMALVWVLHAPLGAAPWRGAGLVAGAGLVTLAVAGSTRAGLPLPWTVLGMSLPITVTVAVGASRDETADRSAGPTTP